MRLKNEIERANTTGALVPANISACLGFLDRWFREAKAVITENVDSFRILFERYGEELHVEVRACHPIPGFDGRVSITASIVVKPSDDLTAKIREINSEHDRITGAWHAAARSIGNNS